jgi:hypothetical protein
MHIYRCETPDDLAVSFDAGWQTRGSGRNYASLSGMHLTCTPIIPPFQRVGVYDFTFVYFSIHNKFSSKISQQLLIAEASIFNTLFFRHAVFIFCVLS